MADEIFFLKARDEIAKELLGFFYRIVRTKYKAQNIYLRTRMNFFFFFIKTTLSIRLHLLQRA